MARRTTGRVYQRGARWWVHYEVNGQRVRHSLPKEIKTEKQATQALEKEVAPFHKADEAGKAKAMVHRMKDAEEAAAAAVDLKLEEAWQAFDQNNVSKRADKTRRMYKQRWQAFLDWLAVEQPSISTLSQVTRPIALAYAEHLGSLNIAPSTFNAHRQALAMVTGKVIVKSGANLSNPWDVVDTQSLDTVSRKEFTRQQAAHLLDQLARPGFEIQSRAMVEREGEEVRSSTMYPLANQDEWHVAFNLGTFTGLRLADCVTLTWDSIDFRKGELSTIPLKTKRKLKRVHVRLHPDLTEALQTARQRVPADEPHICPALARRYAYNPAGVDKDAVSIIDAAFPDLETTRQMKGRDKAAVLYGFHSLRHTFVSICAEEGVPMAIVESIVGHGSPAMTRHYTHISPEAARKAVEAINLKPAGELVSQAEPTTESRMIHRIRTRLAKEDVPEAVATDIRALLDGGGE